MALRLYSLILGFFFFQSIQAQSIIMLNDETKTGFKLIAEGYLQNEVPREKMNIKGLPPDGTQLFFEMEDGRVFSRKLPQLAKGNHQYIIYQDFENNLRLRYRGKHKKLSQSALLFTYKKDKPYTLPERTVVTVETPDSAKIIVQKDSSQSKKAIAVLTPSEIKETPKANPVGHKLPYPQVEKEKTGDSIKAVTTRIETTEEPGNTFDFNNALAQINTSNFEFDKLQLAKKLVENESIGSEELQQIFKSFKYDQSRLDLLQTYRTKRPKSVLKTDMLKSFDYELSKQAAQKIIDETSSK